MSGGFDCNSVSAAERPEPPRSERLCAETRTVTPSYFDTLGLHLLAGRTLSRQDRADAPPVTVISHALAAALWPGEPAVGRRLRAFGGEMEVVGVVGDVKHQRLDEPSPASLFMTREQSLAQWQIHWSTVLLRTSGDPTALLPAARRAVWSLDPALPLSAETTLERLVADSVSTERLRTVLLVAFAAVATVLAALGLYGVLAYLVVQRRFELAVRLALGARRGRVVRMVVGQGLVLVLAGVGLGLAAALALSRLLAGLLFQVAPTDPAAFLTVALLMLAVGLAASWLPARRAASVEPAQALRGG
jgi:putative ABC transport system permease protein